MKNYRINRLFYARSSRCFAVSLDQGFFNERDFLEGIENMAKAVQALVIASPDAIQLTVGQAHLLQSLPGRNKPALVLRTDTANVHGNTIPKSLHSRMIEAPVEQALRADAACVVVNLLRVPQQPEITDQCLQNIMRLKPECDRFGMPMMIEAQVLAANQKTGGFAADGDLDRILPLIRQAVELGADVVKCDSCDDAKDFNKMVEIAGRIPLLVRGVGRSDDRDTLDRTEKLIAQGAAGVVHGRNIVQHANPTALTKALMAIIHEGATAREAAEHLKKT